MKKGFVIHANYWQNSQIRELSPLQRGILVDIFNLLASETDKQWWGFITDYHGKPISERALRAEINDPPLSPNTWQAARDEFFRRGIFKKLRLKNCDYIYCPAFIEMNPYEMARKTNTMINQDNQEKPNMLKSELYVGYDPDDTKSDDDMSTWELVCREWLILSDGKPPVSANLPMSSKIEIRDDIVRMVDEAGVKNAIHDMRIAFEFKARQGGRINSIEYMLMRWRSKDWMKRVDKSERLSKSVNADRMLRKTIVSLKKQKVISSITELINHYPTYDSELLRKIGKECGLND